MAIRTLKFAPRYDPANSRAIGYHATQENAAYNHAVDVPNREPEPPKRSGRIHPDALDKRATAWRQANRQKADAPYCIHQQGAAEAWEVNQRMREARQEPKHRDTRPHRRTLRRRSRKRRPLSLTITDRRLFAVSDDYQTLASRQCGLSIRLRGTHALEWLDIRTIRRVPVKDYRPRTPLHRRHYCLHVQVPVPEPHRRQAPCQQTTTTRRRKAQREGTTLRQDPRPRDAPADPEDTHGSPAQDGRRRKSAPHQHDGLRPWHR